MSILTPGTRPQRPQPVGRPIEAKVKAPEAGAPPDKTQSQRISRLPRGVDEVINETAGANGASPEATALSQVQRSLSRLRGSHSLQELMDRATSGLCLTCGFDRAMLSLVVDARLVVRSAAIPADPEFAKALLDFARSNRPRLDHMLIETEMVRRRRPILVANVDEEPRAHREFTRFLSTRGYVAAPIMPTGRVIGFLHADLHYSDRAPDVMDRERLWAFAEGCGFAVERTWLAERLRRAVHGIRGILGSVDVALDDFHALNGGPLDEGPNRAIDVRPQSMIAVEGVSEAELLTSREREVLELMATGLSNVDIAERLVIAGGTVKTHVSHILRKLQARNRAEAVSRYLQAR